MKRDNQDDVCAFVREIVSSRTGEPAEFKARPDQECRDAKAVDEFWESASHRYAVEHTLIESFQGQLANVDTIKRLLIPVKQLLDGRLPGRFALAVTANETASARVNFVAAHKEIARLVVEAASDMTVQETRFLESQLLPFKMRLHLRFKEDSRLILYTEIEGDAETLRAERIKRALDAKCPKLAVCKEADGRTTILILEADDSQLSNVSVVLEALGAILEGRKDQPDLIVLVETDAAPWSGWVLKEGAQIGKDVQPKASGGYMYERGTLS